MVKMSHLATGHVLKTFNLGYGPVRTLQLSADSTILVTGHDEGHVVVSFRGCSTEVAGRWQ